MRSLIGMILILICIPVWSQPEDQAALLISRVQSHNARLRLIQNETKEIRLMTYIFDLDEMGLEIISALMDAAARGVKVKVAVDGIFRGLPKQRAYLKLMEEAGIEVKIYHPLFRQANKFNHRNHQKNLIGSMDMITGDRNMATGYFGRKEVSPHGPPPKGTITVPAVTEVPDNFVSRGNPTITGETVTVGRAGIATGEEQKVVEEAHSRQMSDSVVSNKPHAPFQMQKPISVQVTGVETTLELEKIEGIESKRFEGITTASVFQRKGHHNYVSVDVMVRGSQLDVARRSFDELFDSSQMSKPKGFLPYKKVLVPKVVTLRGIDKPLTPVKNMRYVADAVGVKKSEGIAKDILNMFRSAQESIDIMNPYVVLTDDMKTALREAHARGVTIRLISNSSAANDQKLMGRAWDITKHELLELGIDVFEVQEGMFVHAKVIVVDGKHIYIGSFNLDGRSEVLNLENGVFFEDEKMAKLIVAHNRRIAGLSHQVSPEDIALIGAQKGCSIRVIDKLIGLLRPNL